MKKHVIIFEVRGGSEKGPYGFRRDSKPIIDSLKKRLDRRNHFLSGQRPR